MDVNISSNTTTTVNIGQLLRVIGFWGIFSRYGEPGWKAIIPIYGEWIWSKIVGEEKTGKRYVIVSIILLCVLVLLAIAATVGFIATEKAEVTLADGTTSYQIENFPIPAAIAIVLCSIATVVLFVYAMILHFRLGKAHVKMEHAASWFKWIWLFFPGLAAIYFGFIHHKYYIESFWDKDYDPRLEQLEDDNEF